MPDREKVIKGLEHCFENGCRDCPYVENCVIYEEFFSETLIKDVLELLKEQKPVKPIVEQYALPLTNTSVRFIKKHYCGICNEEITGNNVYCHKCGRKVKWDDSDRNENG